MKLTSLHDLASLGVDTVIDARAPSEFAEDHLPGAINLPVLSDTERAEIGTIYKQESPFLARKRGAALVAMNVAQHLLGPLADKPGDWQPLVYCWRGGQRSGSFATILRQIGWRVAVLDGGYKSYRRLVQAQLYDTPFPAPVLLLDGGTGVAKTEILVRVADMGGQVLDLEALAAHRGSLFGGEVPQPSQKLFETRLAQAMVALDPKRAVLIEAESNRIGSLRLPPALWQAMRSAPHVEIAAPLDARVAHILRAYRGFCDDPARLAQTLEKLRPYQPKEHLTEWQQAVVEGRFAALVADLILQHYDPRYARARRRSASLEEITLPDLSEMSQNLAAQRLVDLMELRKSASQPTPWIIPQ
ncbi:MAG: tRNA 2-selenouridine(34) synthase MnmH [Roseinatronobacter sp.]